LRNRGFAVPHTDDRRWQEIAEARATIEPATLRLSVERGDLRWEARVRAAHHELFRTPALDATGALSEKWSQAHHRFHRVLLEGCGNPVLLESFERLWTASELARHWAGSAAPERDYIGEHAALEQAALDRDADRAEQLLAQHLMQTAATLQTPSPPR
jgi:DNA-binding GntR family transcriptional regulator